MSTVLKTFTSSDRCERGFVTTSWTLIANAGARDGQSRRALAELCRSYWYPLYAYARRRQSASEDADDVVQSFFAWLIEQNVLDRADPNRGRFRCFLIATFKQFLTREHRYQSATKRCPNCPVVSIDATDGRSRYDREPFHELTPDKQFEYSWALEVIKLAMTRLRNEFQEQGKQERFEALKEFLTGPLEVGGKEVAIRLGVSEGAVRVAVHRLKRRFAEILREEVGQTLETASEIDEELRHLVNALKH